MNTTDIPLVDGYVYRYGPMLLEARLYELEHGHQWFLHRLTDSGEYRGDTEECLTGYFFDNDGWKTVISVWFEIEKHGKVDFCKVPGDPVALSVEDLQFIAESLERLLFPLDQDSREIMAAMN
jgi:hypothetical protein